MENFELELKKAFNNGYLTGIMAYNFVRVSRRIDKSWYIEDIRNRTGLGDISFATRRLDLSKTPDSIYNIYVDNGVIKTATRGMSELDKWHDQFELSTGTAVAIAFNGRWEQINNTWRMVTDEVPNLFWVNNGNLYNQIWDNITTRTLLATDVSKIKAIRAWKSVNMPKVDQGLIVGYIKSDGVYYRNYAYQEDGVVVWESEKQVYSGVAENLNLFLTNDYRMGFAIEDNLGKIHIHITSRAWVGMGIGSEMFYVRPDMNIDFLPIAYHDRYGFETFNVKPKLDLSYLYASSYNEIIYAENIDDGEGNFGKKVFVRTKHCMFNVSLSEFGLVDTADIFYNPVSIQEVSSTEFIVEFLNFNNSIEDLTINFIRSTTTNEAGYAFDNMSITFTPVGLIPIAIPVPEVEEVWNE